LPLLKFQPSYYDVDIRNKQAPNLKSAPDNVLSIIPVAACCRHQRLIAVRSNFAPKQTLHFSADGAPQ